MPTVRRDVRWCAAPPRPLCCGLGWGVVCVCARVRMALDLHCSRGWPQPVCVCVCACVCGRRFEETSRRVHRLLTRADVLPLVQRHANSWVNRVIKRFHSRNLVLVFWGFIF